MPERRPIGLPKRLKLKKLTKRIKVSSAAPMAVISKAAEMAVKTGKASTGGKAGTEMKIRAGSCKEAVVNQDLVEGAAAAAADPPAMDLKVASISKSETIGPVISAVKDVKAATKARPKPSLIAIAARRRASSPWWRLRLF